MTGAATGAGRLRGSARSARAITESSRATSSTKRPIGPSVEPGFQRLAGRDRGTTPTVGRSPTTPHHAAGLRSEPPRSLPSAIATMPVASAAAAPPDDPPTVRSGSAGLRVGPCTGLKVLLPAPNSGTLVLPTHTAPAARTGRHDRAVGRRDVPDHGRRPHRSRQACDVDEVLVGDHQPAQRSGVEPAGPGGVDRCGPLPAHLRGQCHHRVHERVGAPDHGEVGVEQLPGGDLPGPQHGELLDGGPQGDGVAHAVPVPVRGRRAGRPWLTTGRRGGRGGRR